MNPDSTERTEELLLGKQLMAEQYPHIPFTDLEVIQGGSIKTIWKLSGAKGTFCLKRIRKSIPMVAFTTAAQAYLYNKGALVAEIMPTRTNELYMVHGEHALVVYRWIDGSELEMVKNEEHFYTGLRGLARFHLDTVGFVPPRDGIQNDRMGVWPEHYAKMTAELRRWQVDCIGGATPFQQTYKQMTEEMIAMADQAIRLLHSSCYAKWVRDIGPYGFMCHQDYGKGNALQTPNGIYVLDLDNLAYDIPLRDVRKLIFKRLDHIGLWDMGHLEQMLEAYQAIFPLTPEQRQLLYIDLLFPHKYYGYAKNPFLKGEAGDVEKLMKQYRLEMDKYAMLQHALELPAMGGESR